jgi:hypothetical protein
MIHIPQLPLLQIGFLILLLIAPIFVIYRTYKELPQKRQWILIIALTGILTFVSLIMSESRGGLPRGMSYGWPKGFITLRQPSIYFSGFYFFIDIIFYFVVVFWVYSIKKLFHVKRTFLAIGFIVIALVAFAAAVKSSYVIHLELGTPTTNIEYSSLLSEDEAIEIVKNAYPTLRDYPSDMLPPKSIYAEKDDHGWYLGFIQEGSGLPFLGGQCFFVADDKTISETGTLKPIFGDTSRILSVRDCTLR